MLVQFNKADKKEPKIFRLTGIEPHFVSLVNAGANRQKKFQVVKADDEQLAKAGSLDEVAGTEDDAEKFQGSPRNRYGTHSSYGFKGDYAKAWRVYMSQWGGGKPGAAATGSLRGTVRRVSMIAAAKKPSCSLPSTDSIEARGGDPSPLSGDFPETPADYGLTAWEKAETDEQKEGIKLSCDDLSTIKRTALAEIKRRAEDAEKSGDDADGDDKGSSNTDKDGSSKSGGTDPLDWLERASETMEGLAFVARLQSVNVPVPKSSDSSPGDDALADVGKSQSTPSVKQLTEQVSTLEQQLEAEKSARSDAEARVKELEKQLAAQTKLTKRAETNVKKLKRSMGGPSALLTGEVSTRTEKRSDSGTDAPWAGGGDLAAKVKR